MSDDLEKLKKSVVEWRELLSEEAYAVLFKEATEPAGTSSLNQEKREGIFICAACYLPLFESSAKYESGTGWPSFTRPVQSENVNENFDDSLGMRRVEVRSVHGDSHLGHVFPDGPEEAGGMRYCINSASLRFIPVEELEAEGYDEFKNLFSETLGETK